VHAPTKSHLTNSGGQHGQESEEGKEGEEGEERSEEDCEEDPQGRQEEEVRFALWNCRQLDAGDVTRAGEGLFLENRFSFRFWSTKEGVGETSGQTVGSLVSVFPQQPVRQKNAMDFICALRSVRISNIRNVTGGFGRGGS